MSERRPLAVLEGTVVHGKKLGGKLGIPTINIPYPLGSTRVRDGVYVAEAVLLEDGNRIVPGVLNQGYHPTVPDGDPAVEMHLIDFGGDLYGQRVIVRFLEYLRPELVFDSKEAMRLVMLDDIARARRWFEERGELEP